MRILLFTENTHAGGLDTFIASLIRHWPHKDDEWVVVCNASHPGLAGLRARLPETCRVVAHTMPLYIDVIRRSADSWLMKSLRRIFGPLIRYGYFFYHLLALRSILREANADRLLVVNGGHPGGDSCRAATIVWRSVSLSGRGAIYNFHNLAAVPRWFEYPVECILDYWLMRSVSRLLTVSGACEASVRNRPVMRGTDKLSYIHNGIEPVAARNDRGQVDIRAELGIPKESHLCLMLATYEPRKGHAFLLQAFARIVEREPDAHLVICGYGYPEEVRRVEQQVAALGLEQNVHLQGYRSDTVELLRHTDILVVPSQSFESFGLISVEAMAQRVPVVATRVGGIPEVVVDGEGGFCVSPDDPGGFADRVVELLADPARRAEQGERGQQRFKKYFRAERMASEYAAVIRDAPLPK